MKLKQLRVFFVLAASLLLAQTKAAAQAAHEETVSIDTTGGKVVGSLMLPASPGRVPVALIIAGSGPTDRDGNNRIAGTNNSLKMLAQALAAAGYASLRYDKRGVGASLAAAPTEADLRFDSYVADAVAWSAMLARDARFSSVVVIGHSEGSLIGMIAAEKTKVSGFVSIAGSAQRLSSTLRQQLAGNLTPALAAENERILTSLEHGELSGQVPAALNALYRPSVQPYLISAFQHVPAKRIVMLRVPVLIVQGTTDLQVTVAEAEALKKARPQATLAIIPGMNHVLKLAAGDRTQQARSYADPALPIAPQLIAAITSFLRSVPVR
jgi:alpha-beta hydrolase superfamily lysophospholipase